MCLGARVSWLWRCMCVCARAAFCVPLSLCVSRVLCAWLASGVGGVVLVFMHLCMVFAAVVFTSRGVCRLGCAQEEQPMFVSPFHYRYNCKHLYWTCTGLRIVWNRLTSLTRRKSSQESYCPARRPWTEASATPTARKYKVSTSPAPPHPTDTYLQPGHVHAWRHARIRNRHGAARHGVRRRQLPAQG